MSSEKCRKCGADVDSNTVGLNYKMVNRATEEFLCIDCLSEYYRVDKEDLKKVIERYKKLGCTLFN